MAKNKKHAWVTARVIGNSGNTSFLETTSDKLIVLHRGHSPLVLDLFRDEFLAKLPVGKRFNVVEFDDGTVMFEGGRI